MTGTPLGMVNFSKAAYLAVPEDQIGPGGRNMILFFDDFLDWRFPKVTAKVKLVEWILPSNVELSSEELECPRCVIDTWRLCGEECLAWVPSWF